MSFTIFYIENTPLYPIKTRSSKSTWFRSKNGQFSNFFLLGNRCQENVFYDIQERKKAFLAYKNKKLKKVKNWLFRRRVKPWFWSKNGPFFNFFLCNIGQENVFYGILERKNPFLGYKKRSSKSRKIDIFPKGLTHGFGLKMALFPTFIVYVI